MNAVVLTRVGRQKSGPLDAVLHELEATLGRALSVSQQRALLELLGIVTTELLNPSQSVSGDTDLQTIGLGLDAE